VKKRTWCSSDICGSHACAHKVHLSSGIWRCSFRLKFSTTSMFRVKNIKKLNVLTGSEKDISRDLCGRASIWGPMKSANYELLGYCSLSPSLFNVKKLKKIHGLSPRSSYADQATAACRRSYLHYFHFNNSFLNEWKAVNEITLFFNIVNQRNVWILPSINNIRVFRVTYSTGKH
jgi:hypothetical protein